jgi:tetratricopeptide (TPR) repeat protein
MRLSRTTLFLPTSKLLIVLVFSWLHAGCSGDKPEKKTEEPVSSPAPGGGSSETREDSGPSSMTSERRFLINSLSNNNLTSRSIDKSRAADLAGQYSSGRSKDINSLAAAISSGRLAGQSVNEIMASARGMADLEMAKNIERDIPEIVQLELGLSGLNNGRLAFAEYWLDRLIKSKNSTIRASAINAKGVMAIRMGRIPEAVAMFKEALSANNEYRPALLNLGFLALQGGDVTTAKRALGGMQDDWYVESALVSVLRLEGESDKADTICEKVLSKRPRHKPTLINCGINAWQGKKDYKKARDYLNKALSVAGGLAVWDEKTGRLLGAIDTEETRAAQLKARKEAEERKAKADAAKAKSEAPAKEAPKDSGGEQPKPEAEGKEPKQ